MKEVLTPMDILEEHLPPGISVLIVGPPGSGKTILSQQLLFRVLKGEESVVCVTSKSQINQIISQKKLFNWEVASYLENERIGVVEIGDVADPTELSIGLSRAISRITSPVSLIVLDSLTVLMVGMEQRKIMKFVESLTRKLQEQNVSLLLLITPTKETEDFLTKMKSLVSSVIEIELIEKETIHRFMRIFKFLERRHSTLWYSFDITDKGIQFTAPSIKTPDTYIFDLDGTLVRMGLDSEQIKKEVDTILVKRGYPEEFLDSEMSILETIEQGVHYLRDYGWDWEKAKNEAETLLEQAEKEAVSGTVCIEGAQTVLEILKEKKKKVGVITENKREVAQQVIKKCGLLPYVNVLLTRDDVTSGKLHETQIVQAVEKLGSSPEKTVVVGDHHEEVEAGKKTGCFAVGVLTGAGTRKTLKSANVILNSIKDLKEILTTVGK